MMQPDALQTSPLLPAPLLQVYVGDLAAELLHDINNASSVVQSHATLIAGAHGSAILDRSTEIHYNMEKVDMAVFLLYVIRKAATGVGYLRTFPGSLQECMHVAREAALRKQIHFTVNMPPGGADVNPDHALWLAGVARLMATRQAPVTVNITTSPGSVLCKIAGDAATPGFAESLMFGVASGCAVLLHQTATEVHLQIAAASAPTLAPRV